MHQDDKLRWRLEPANDSLLSIVSIDSYCILYSMLGKGRGVYG